MRVRLRCSSTSATVCTPLALAHPQGGTARIPPPPPRGEAPTQEEVEAGLGKGAHDPDGVVRERQQNPLQPQGQLAGSLGALRAQGPAQEEEGREKDPHQHAFAPIAPPGEGEREVGEGGSGRGRLNQNGQYCR